VVKVFWSLEDKLAYRRHFPAISWLNSYSLYVSNLEEYQEKHLGREWLENVNRALALLQQEAELEEIVRLVGLDALSPDNRLIMETAKSIREDFLHQNAFHEIDTYSSYKKMVKLMDIILHFHELADDALRNDMSILDIASLPIREDIARAKYVREENLSEYDKLKDKITKSFQELKEKVSTEA
jgi:V/A-type H+-transporting ATPase subunit A